VTDYGPATYGDRIAAVYDRYLDPSVEATTHEATEFLHRLVGTGRALELGIGTGRVALPLAGRGAHVEGIMLLPVQLRYAWPSELDLMARLAGLRLRQRYSGWRGEQFTSTSAKHVSVYERNSGPQHR
jgi:SAM-dependent methyltransferase